MEMRTKGWVSLVILRIIPEEMGSETMGVLSDFESLHPMRDAVSSKTLVDCYFRIVGQF